MPITIVADTDRAPRIRRRQEPVRLGVPIHRGLLAGPDGLRLVDSSGAEHPIQTRVLDRWGDGSVRWLLVDFQADDAAVAEPPTYHIVGDRAGDPVLHAQPVRAFDQQGEVIVDTGVAAFHMQRRGRFPFDDVRIGGTTVVDVVRTSLHVEDVQGESRPVVLSETSIEEAGPLHATIRLDGWAGESEREALVQIIARLHFFAGSPTVRFDLTLRNPRRAEHPGGIWELGDPGSVYLQHVAMRVALSAADGPVDLACSPEVGSALASYASPFELFQDSSGGENWQSRNHVNRHGVVPLSFRGYRLRAAGDAEGSDLSGDRATPIATLRCGPQSLAVTLPQFWQNFPKAVGAEPDALALHLFPRRADGGHELQGGEQKTHTFYVAFGHDAVSEVPLDWARTPLVARTTPVQFCSSGAVPYVVPASNDSSSEYARLVNTAIDGDDTFSVKRERIDEYGWRNFGDLYADHENTYYRGPRPVISHYNNQYDATFGFALQFMRSGDLRWWRYMTELAEHVVDIDLYHTDEDRAAYNHGLHWHTSHYTDAGLSTHRAFPKAEGVGGGGPANEHVYTSGLLLHHVLTGDSRSREAVVGLAHWVLAIDDGTRTPFRWLSRSETGGASATYSTRYHGPGRGAGNAINALLDGHRLTGDPELLHKAESLIRRCIHPDDDIPARDLLNAEARWSYTVFLFVLGRYLDYKSERAQIDRPYRYARESLLAYARWMAAHERPYLDHPEALEFPTETWAAQDMRKSDVLKLAAQHASADERPRLLERATFFFRYSTRTLSSMPTHSMTRPTVLMLSHGYLESYFHQHPDVGVVSPAGDPSEFGRPERFVPQRQRAQRAAVVVGVGLMLVLLVIVVLLAS